MVNVQKSIKYLALILSSIFVGNTWLMAQDQTLNGNLTVSGTLKIGTSTNSGSFELRNNGIMIWKGNSSATLLPEDEEWVGKKLMLWHPGKAAFRAGMTDDEIPYAWSEEYIGNYSVAFGINTFAYGEGSTAAGIISVAWGRSSTAFGFAAHAMGNQSFATGNVANALGDNSTSFGNFTYAIGYISTSFGEQTEADASHVFVIGRYNIGGGNPTQWVDADPLFEIGNGVNGALSNAFTIYKNGNANLQGNFIISGASSQMPNQQITGTASILTKGLADGLYLPASTTNSPYITSTVASSTYLTISQASSSYLPLSPTAPSSYALGYQSTVSGTGSVAIGYRATATGSLALATGANTKATGSNSTAMGYYSVASGDYASTALGWYTTASGAISVAMGNVTIASGWVSTAMGNNTIAQGHNQFVIGRYNIAQGDPSNWVSTDDLFIIGNGSSGTVRSNAFVVKKNGDTKISGTATISGGLQVAGDIVTGTASKLVVTATNGTQIVPQGDLSMGSFTSSQPLQ